MGTGYGAENAVDGNTATCTRSEQIGQNSPDKTVWWKVDLGGVYNIYSVNILFKNYEEYGIDVRIFKKPSTFHFIMYILILNKLILYNCLNSFKVVSLALVYR